MHGSFAIIPGIFRDSAPKLQPAGKYDMVDFSSQRPDGKMMELLLRSQSSK